MTQDKTGGEGPTTALATEADQLSWKKNPLLLQARFPGEMDQRALVQFAQVCMAVNLNPFLGEMVPIHGRPYVTEEGWLRMIDERAPGELVSDIVELATKEEKELFVGEKVRGWMGKAVVTRRMFRPQWAPADAPPFEDRMVTEWYFLSQEAVQASVINAVKEEPFRQAMKGAHVRALRKAFRDVLAVAGDFAIEEDFDPEVAAQISATIKQNAEVSSEDSERRRFWARAAKLGIKNGSVELSGLFGLEKHGIGIMKSDWLDQGHTWMEANAILDRYEAGPDERVKTPEIVADAEMCSECHKAISPSDDMMYLANGDPVCSPACGDKGEERLERMAAQAEIAARPKRRR